MIYIFYGTMLLILTIPHQTITAFTISPSSQVVGVGQMAVFRCQNLNALVIFWRVNEIRVTFNKPHPDPGITISTTRDENNDVVNLLSIDAQSKYNETIIVCAANIQGGGSNDTTPVKLLIQGPLSMVTEIKRNSSIITWEAPFSLDLTGVDPDIVYCVKVYNITCGVDDLVVGDCDVTETRFIDNRLQQGYIYRITITPRSNGQDVQNGTSNTKEEIFTSMTDPETSIRFRSRSTIVTAAVIRFRDDGTGVKPASYFLKLTSIDGTEKVSKTILVMTNTQDTNANSTTLRVSQSLPYRRLWNCQILALDCSEHPITNLFEISTHDFQKVTVNSSRTGEISVTGDFIPGSSAIDILIVVYSADDESNIDYHFINRSNVRTTTSMTNVPSGRYKVSVFVVEGNGLPFNRSATTPRDILIEGGDVQSFFEHVLYLTSTGIYVNCTFLDISTTGCVVVVHQRISQLSSSGLMNIESSHKLNRSGDTAYGCIEEVNLTLYQIGVFSLEEVVPTPPTSPRHVLDVGIIIVTTMVALLITILLLATVLIVCCKKRILSLIQSIREYMQKKSRVSSTTRQLTTGLPISQTHDEEAYDILRGQVKQSQVTAKEGVLNTSINLDPPSGVIVMGHDDLHKTTTHYSELQHKPQEEESSFNKFEGPCT